MGKKISTAELKVMNIIWERPDINAREVVDEMKKLEDWNKNTTYTLLKRLIEKELIKREEPNFSCSPLVSREEITYNETVSFLDKLYNGSFKLMISSFLSQENISEKELEEIKRIIEEKK